MKTRLLSLVIGMMLGLSMGYWFGYSTKQRSCLPGTASLQKDGYMKLSWCDIPTGGPFCFETQFKCTDKNTAILDYVHVRAWFTPEVTGPLLNDAAR